MQNQTLRNAVNEAQGRLDDHPGVVTDATAEYVSKTFVRTLLGDIYIAVINDGFRKDRAYNPPPTKLTTVDLSSILQVVEDIRKPLAHYSPTGPKLDRIVDVVLQVVRSNPTAYANIPDRELGQREDAPPRRTAMPRVLGELYGGTLKDHTAHAADLDNDPYRVAAEIFGDEYVRNRQTEDEQRISEATRRAVGGAQSDMHMLNELAMFGEMRAAAPPRDDTLAVSKPNWPTERRIHEGHVQSLPRDPASRLYAATQQAINEAFKMCADTEEVGEMFCIQLLTTLRDKVERAYRRAPVVTTFSTPNSAEPTWVERQFNDVANGLGVSAEQFVAGYRNSPGAERVVSQWAEGAPFSNAAKPFVPDEVFERACERVYDRLRALRVCSDYGTWSELNEFAKVKHAKKTKDLAGDIRSTTWDSLDTFHSHVAAVERTRNATRNSVLARCIKYVEDAQIHTCQDGNATVFDGWVFIKRIYATRIVESLRALRT